MATQLIQPAEHKSDTQDFSVQLPDASAQQQQLRFIILTPSTVTAGSIDTTLTRLQRHASATEGHNYAAMFLLSPAPTDESETTWPSPLHAFNQLQITLACVNVTMPLLPITDASTLPSVVAAFAKPLAIKLPLQKPVNAAMDLLPYCSTEAPVKQQTIVFMTDQAACLRDVASLREGDMGKLMEAGLYAEEAEAALVFWAEEWIVD